MARTWAELTPAEALAHQQRIERALGICDDAALDLARRRAEAATPLRVDSLRETIYTPPLPTAAPEQPVRRPASAPRDWLAEAAYFCGQANAATDEKIEHLVGGIGIAIAQIRAELRKEFNAALILARRDVIDEVRREFTAKVEDMRSQFRTALAGDADTLMRRLQKIDEMLDRFQRTELALRDPKFTIDVRPN
jgi:hypothetical protein